MTKERSTLRTSELLAALALLALGGCVNGNGAAAPALTPTERFAIEVAPQPQELKLAPHATGLSAAQSAALQDFARQWAGTDRPAITLKAPEHGPDPTAAYRTATAAYAFLIAQGVDAAKLRIVGYESGGDAHAPIVVGFVRYEAKGPDCGHAWSNIAAVADNREYAEFGCAVTANVAAQVADPADLLSPRASDPVDAVRREDVVTKYGAATLTSSPKDAQADGTFAAVGQ